jgi:riboflavin kinase/FMN adenylyltransferase
VKLIRALAALPEQLRSGAVAIGNFDGVHLGHARIVKRLIDKAREVRGPAVVFTFDPHPAWLLRPAEAPPPLTWTDRKVELLVELGVDCMIAYPTDEALLNLSPREFFDRIVRQKLDARAMVEGPNFFFGHNRAGNIEVLGELCREAAVSLDVVEPVAAVAESSDSPPPTSGPSTRYSRPRGSMRDAAGSASRDMRRPSIWDPIRRSARRR